MNSFGKAAMALLSALAMDTPIPLETRYQPSNKPAKSHKQKAKAKQAKASRKRNRKK